VNRDLSRRVRPISGIAQHVTCARNDLRNMARLIMHLDAKWKIWEQDAPEVSVHTTMVSQANVAIFH